MAIVIRPQRAARGAAALRHALLALLCTGPIMPAPAQAQDAPQTVTVTGRSAPAGPSIGGFGDVPLARSPFAAAVQSQAQMQDTGTERLADLTRWDASISDAYNAEGYWSSLTVRGFVLDNRSNYRRDGLPINAETALPLANRERLEVLKGTSGIQAGTSAPGGLVNMVVKRPDHNVRAAQIGARADATLGAAIDISQRFGADDAFGLRVNAAYEHLDPPPDDARGKRHLLALAGDWRLSTNTLLEAEVETARQSQPSVPGFSLLGNAVPDANRIDPRTNLNNQAWSLPVVLVGHTASLRLQQTLSERWRFVAHGMTQRLTSDDRIAFPFGCSAEGNFDRYCSDGTFDLYDFRSDNERRRSDALDLAFSGSANSGPIEHRASAGVLLTRFEGRFGRQANNFAGIGNIDGSLATPPAPELTDENTNRDERSTEWYLRDAMQLLPRWQLWAGLRYTRLHRESVRTDGSRPTAYAQSATTPWLAIAHEPAPGHLLYASWGRGLETEVVPNRALYVNRGQALPALKSRQLELGYKVEMQQGSASIDAFDIERPQAADFGACDDTDDSCERRIDGNARHRGIEAQANWALGDWQLNASALALRARREGSADPTINGLRPINVPARSVRLRLAHDVAALPGLSLFAGAAYESDRVVLPDNSLRIGGWTRYDAGARYVQRAAGATWTLRAGVDNLGNKRAWKEAPYQFGHVYLFPLPPRTWRVSLQAEL